MPEVALIHFTGKGTPDETHYAARLLAFTKATRLNMTPDTYEKFSKMSDEELKAEIEYMATTIPSSWEFVDLVFLVQKISRATAQQMTRTRNASFAMQSQRVTNMADVTWDKHNKEFAARGLHDLRMLSAVDAYRMSVDEGMTLEDARDLLPIGCHCNLVAKYSLRAFVELAQKRDSLRVQGPYVEVVKQMKEQVLAVWPWAEPFFRPKHEASIALIEAVAKELAALSDEKGAMYKGLTGRLAKAADLLKA